MNAENDVYWEKKKAPEYPMFQELKESKPSWDNVKQVFDVKDKNQRFYGGILGNEVADKERRRSVREQERLTKESKDNDKEDQEEEYFKSLRTQLRSSNDSDGETSGSQQGDDRCSCDKAKGMVCKTCTTMKKSRSFSNPHNKKPSPASSPKNTGTNAVGISHSKFKNP